MKMFIHIFFTSFILILFFPTTLSSQKLEQGDDFENRVEYFRKSIKSNSKTEAENRIYLENQAKRISVLEKRNEDLEKLLDKSLAIYGNTSGSIGNQMDSLANNLSYYSWLFSILGIGLGIYLTWIADKINKARDKGQEYLEKQKQLHQDMLGNIPKIHKQLKEEELEYIIKNVGERPSFLMSSLSQLYFLKPSNTYFNRFINLFVHLESNKEEPGFSPDLLSFIFNQYPEQLANHSIGITVLHYWDKIGGVTYRTSLLRFTQQVVVNFIQDDSTIDKESLSNLLQKIFSNTILLRVSSKNFFDSFSTEQEHRKILDFLVDEKIPNIKEYQDLYNSKYPSS
jgi:hypothetical protein